MTDGKSEFEKSLLQAEAVAERYELQLPHVSDIIYKQIKLIRIYDKTIEKLLKISRKQARNIKELNEAAKYMSNFLTGRKLRKVESHMKKWRKKRKR